MPKTREGEAWKKLDALKKESTGQLLMKCARLLDERAVARVAKAGPVPKLRPAHTRLFPHIDPEGTRLTELARRLGITKQAVGQLVDDLVEMGTLQVVADPDDRRARRVRFSPRGMEAIAHGLGVLAQIEADLAERIGKRRMSELRGTLAALLEALEGLDQTPAR